MKHEPPPIVPTPLNNPPPLFPNTTPLHPTCLHQTVFFCVLKFFFFSFFFAVDSFPPVRSEHPPQTLSCCSPFSPKFPSLNSFSRTHLLVLIALTLHVPASVALFPYKPLPSFQGALPYVPPTMLKISDVPPVFSSLIQTV